MPWIERALRALRTFAHFNIGATLACAAWLLLHSEGQP